MQLFFLKSAVQLSQVEPDFEQKLFHQNRKIGTTKQYEMKRLF